jgi:peptidoglycan/xylan/chitin deacetylase (PgdA/CDA1 family)
MEENKILLNRRIFNKFILFSTIFPEILFAEFETESNNFFNIDLNEKNTSVILVKDNIKEIKLIQEEEKIISNINSKDSLKSNCKNYYLTIDDGYHFKEEILNIANEKNIKLNLFIIGNLICKNPKIWLKAIEDGHLLGSHTFNHIMFSKSSYQKIKNDFSLYKEKVSNSIGKNNFENIEFFRFPYGDKGNKNNYKDIHKLITEEYGWKISKWDLDLSFNTKFFICSYTFPEQQQKISDYCSHSKKENNTVLLHFKKPDHLALREIIKYGDLHGLNFKRLDNKI